MNVNTFQVKYLITVNYSQAPFGLLFKKQMSGVRDYLQLAVKWMWVLKLKNILISKRKIKHSFVNVHVIILLFYYLSLVLENVK